MNWFTWLSRTGLDPSLVYNYALTFDNNELEEDDISYFNHEVLQSMGVSIAKHRLEILKLARKEKSRRTGPVLWFKYAIKQTKNYLAKHVRLLVHCESPELSIVPTRNNSLRWKVSMLQRNKRFKAERAPSMKLKSPRRVDSGQPTLMLTNGSPIAYSQCSFSSQSISSEGSNGSEGGDDKRDDDPIGSKWNSSFSSTVVRSTQDGEYLSSSMEEVKWDCMFQNMKPT